MATASNACLTQDQPWLANSTAIDHLTSSLNQLNFPKPYHGQDQIIVGNGQNLPITYLGNASISLPHSTLHLKNVLRVPSIASNLASVHKICHDNKCWCYFDENIISIQALATGKILYQGKSEDDVYPIYPQKVSQISLSSKTCNSATNVFVFNKTLWHLRFGHPSNQALKHLFPNVKVGLNKCTSVDNSCTQYFYGKMHNLPFPKSQFTASTPFELIHSDLWGPIPMNSINGFKYYVLFIDHFTRFTWIYLLKSKSEVFAKFVQFKAMVEN